ncbi:hypothetical protein V6N11_065276 [Hibiscus sabdariffa]|uniref:Uncharacterized protein n=1 Tax=Hibiscus sabdariffa TaxID=183260 RepID=A0ABR2QGI2_9ROSI
MKPESASFCFCVARSTPLNRRRNNPSIGLPVYVVHALILPLPTRRRSISSRAQLLTAAHLLSQTKLDAGHVVALLISAPLDRRAITTVRSQTNPRAWNHYQLEQRSHLYNPSQPSTRHFINGRRNTTVRPLYDRLCVIILMRK